MNEYDWPPRQLRNLTELEAFDVMRAFLEAYWERGLRSSDDLAVLLGSVNRGHADGSPMDLAQWPDWQEAVEKVLQGRSA
jgi:hypothetical protein